MFEPQHVKTSKMPYAPSYDSDQPAHPHSLIRVFAVRSVGSLGPIVSSCGLGRLESLLDAQVIMLVLSCSGSFVLDNRRYFKCRLAIRSGRISISISLQF